MEWKILKTVSAASPARVCLLTENKQPVYDTTSMRMRSGGHRGDAKCQKRHLSSSNLSFNELW